MGFNSVYRVLQEVFPQVDARVLRAVAIEHTKDADTAVEVVLTEVIPFLSERSNCTGSSASNESGIMINSSEGQVADTNTSVQTRDVPLADSKGLDEPHNDSLFYDASGGHDETCGNNGNDELVSQEKCGGNIINDSPYVFSQSTTFTHENRTNDDRDQVYKNSDNKDNISLRRSENGLIEVESEQSSYVASTTLKDEENGASGSMNGCLPTEQENLNDHSACDVNVAVHDMTHLDQSRISGNSMEVKNAVIQLDSLPIQESTLNLPESSLQLEVVMTNTLVTTCEKPEESSYVASRKDLCTNQMVDLDDEFVMPTVVTRSGQICCIDLLEDIIADARNNKKTLFTAMESVISLMREVELQEKAAEQAKEEAAKGGLDILTKMEDLRQMLGHAKETNDMHAGEVYGEKSILATEVRELQSRLLSLSDERDKSLAILDEMRQALEVRLTAAEREMKEAEQEMLGKEESARKALAEQELIMENVVKESKILKEEAEENSKLREFLIDRGHVVDMLQGEISVICQDVKLLKEKFDERIPLSKSLSSSQTSCILASSSSSLRSMAPDQAAEQADSPGTLKRTSSTPSVDNQHFSGGETARDNQKELMDDGWELFDDCDA